MTFADNAGVRIYYEVVGAGRPLVLHHGYSDSLTTWNELGYVSAFAERRQVIVLDARGHGGSDKPHDPIAYSWDRHTDDVIAVLDAEHIETADFYGVSMGGSVGIAPCDSGTEPVLVTDHRRRRRRDAAWPGLRRVAGPGCAGVDGRMGAAG